MHTGIQSSKRRETTDCDLRITGMLVWWYVCSVRAAAYIALNPQPVVQVYSQKPAVKQEDHIETWLWSHRCASDTQIRTASQKSTVKQDDPVWKFFQANSHFIRNIWSSLHFIWCAHLSFAFLWCCCKSCVASVATLY